MVGYRNPRGHLRGEERIAISSKGKKQTKNNNLKGGESKQREAAISPRYRYSDEGKLMAREEKNQQIPG